MIPTNDRPLFDLAIQQLVAHATGLPQFRGRFIQIFLAMKCFQNEIPSMWSGQFIGTDVLQSLFDDLYCKANRQPNASVWSLATGEFLARTGFIGPNNNTPQNTWRNNLNLQKGIGCYAPPQELASQTFLDEPRAECRYLVPVQAGQLRGATCQLCRRDPTPRYRGEDHRKWLRISPDGRGYATVDLRNINNFAPDVAPGGIRIPLFPLLISLYHDTLEGLPVSGRTQVGLADFMIDFNFSQAEIDTYFDASPDNPLNSSIIAASPGCSINSSTSAVPGTSAPTTPPLVSPEPVATPTQVAPPAENNGWNAERCVQSALESDNWRVIDVSRQRMGYDLYAVKGSIRRYIEVKSSINLCRPVFTAREWQQARVQRRAYVVAIIENFNPEEENIVYWVPDPTSCNSREATTKEYAVGRSAWTPAAIDLQNI